MGVGQQTDFDPNAFGPFGPLIQAYVTAFENLGLLSAEIGEGTVPQRVTAPLKAAARCQLELFGLANRRTQAYMQVPTRLAQCRSPRDLLDEQMRFWRTAAEQYGESYRKIFDVWAGADVWAYPGARPELERDYINFNGTGTREHVPAARPEPAAGKQRRVA